MAITKSAKKAIRNSAKKRVFNIRRKKGFEEVEKQIKKLVVGGKKEEATKLVPDLYKKIDKAVKMKTLKKNTGARKKSRVVLMINKVK